MKNITNFLFELSMLKRQPHSGFALAGVKNLDSLADHTCRAALIGYILADLEGADPFKTAMMLLLHDVHECRIGDHHKVAARYVNTKDAKNTAFKEQLALLPPSIAIPWQKMFDEYDERRTKEGIIAQDADWLETAISAREFLAEGFKSCQKWIENVRVALETDSAKKLLTTIEQTEPTDWWHGLKKMTYHKL